MEQVHLYLAYVTCELQADALYLHSRSVCPYWCNLKAYEMSLVRCAVLYPPCAVKECPAVYDVLRFKPYHLFRDEPLHDRLYATIREFGYVLRQCVV